MTIEKTSALGETKAQPKEQFVHSVFESIAGKYDLMNDILSFRRHKAWRKFTMRKMAMKRGDSAVDLCCGTCDWSIALAEASQTGSVVGLDFSAGMLEVGRGKVEAQGLQDRISLIQGNAMELPFGDNSFDYATIGFGLRNVPDLVQVLNEMKRVVKPGGMVVCLELSKPMKQPFKGIYYFYFEKVLPLLGKLFAKRYEQYKWLPESLALFPDREQLAVIFRETGLTKVESFPLTGGIAALHIGFKENCNV
ncbi:MULTISPECIES: demethylmenaquinone methyltransferase [unclassified Paenibacillus]|uniref:demethylmenaquinone methyltransferase n=1 Tax=unclassified Paenibacillus TaxID=185978 RepID=UPI0024065A32|nr:MULTISPECIES: demethylmenaquinone methyltransferase [unclassified Paenibacillus]MDF9840326.1 demethylmenaquinone methyltransferase/2-methoxy-6-polyprenyl-1,4-benzoquinol methylase [Paenibacillus sp. PastF-2]MDF9846908.1 demethylmenaquinone methyltransferase/2-methoxy-6-polyprenyl-1,4-benzoquinol methylase [Paenibacillus sp. PastM-2]MDF9853480.1 demethylmenaquinone methyltransferase/2-methoxy-6-polyprenyl-1,4-benzoquinol methylase [Paenibacillus sp. PastF-1]MDH6479033.1 demethylmenaquinone me